MKVSNKFSPLSTRSQRSKLTSKKVVSKVSPKKNDDEQLSDATEIFETKKKPGGKTNKPVTLETTTENVSKMSKPSNKGVDLELGKVSSVKSDNGEMEKSDNSSPPKKINVGKNSPKKTQKDYD